MFLISIIFFLYLIIFILLFVFYLFLIYFSYIHKKFKNLNFVELFENYLKKKIIYFYIKRQESRIFVFYVIEHILLRLVTISVLFPHSTFYFKFVLYIIIIILIISIHNDITFVIPKAECEPFSPEDLLKAKKFVFLKKIIAIGAAALVIDSNISQIFTAQIPGSTEMRAHGSFLGSIHDYTLLEKDDVLHINFDQYKRECLNPHVAAVRRAKALGSISNNNNNCISEEQVNLIIKKFINDSKTEGIKKE